MLIRFFAITVLLSLCLAAGCCATGANDTLSTARATHLNLPNN